MISRPVEIHVKIKNATSGTVVIDNGLKQSTLPTGKSLKVVYWRALAIVLPDGYSKEIDCFQLPEDISRKAPPQNKYRTKIVVEHSFELTDEGILYLAGKGKKCYKKNQQIHYDEIIMLPADVEEDAFVSLKIKNEGVTPVRLTEIVPMNPVARHSSAGLVLDSFFPSPLLCSLRKSLSCIFQAMCPLI